MVVVFQDRFHCILAGAIARCVLYKPRIWTIPHHYRILTPDPIFNLYFLSVTGSQKFCYQHGRVQRGLLPATDQRQTQREHYAGQQGTHYTYRFVGQRERVKVVVLSVSLR